ncbi:hypothetical protein ABZV77_11315 [Streptomyces sp. NPDC004732]|uniref:hypothetical protein n=1 Tax=Streptomyces sp. NPDC004732 TaxID=3154290 RepID=UPI0033BB1C05
MENLEPYDVNEVFRSGENVNRAFAYVERKYNGRVACHSCRGLQTYATIGGAGAVTAICFAPDCSTITPTQIGHLTAIWHPNFGQQQLGRNNGKARPKLRAAT